MTTDDLRPLDTVVWAGPDADCGAEPVGRAVAATCAGGDAVVVPLVIPAEGVPLPEGGVGFADLVRVTYDVPGEGWTARGLRGEIGVDAGADVTVPAFGGGPGDVLTFELGGGRAGSCTLA